MTDLFTIQRIPVGQRDAIYTVVDPDGKNVGAHSLRRDAVAARDALNEAQRTMDRLAVGRAIRKGDRVAGIGRNLRLWNPQPTGIVTKTFVVDGEHFYRVEWEGTCVEDDVRRSEISRVAS